MRGLKDKRVLITGGASGIGAATAARFLEEGSAVVVLDRDARGRAQIQSQLPKLAGAVDRILAMTTGDAGLDVNQFGQRVSFFFNAHNDFLEEIAKFRAARRLWARIMRDRFNARDPIAGRVLP